VTGSHPRLLSPELLAQLDDKLQTIRAPITTLWRPGLGEAEMDALTAAAGFSLSTEARTWWAWHDGVDLTAPSWHRGLGNGWDPLPLADALQDALMKRQLATTIAEPNSEWPDSWITLCGEVSYRRIACNCAVPADAPSTIHYFDPSDNMEPTRPKLPSIGELVHAWIEALDDGTWRIDPKTGDFALLDPSELATKGDNIAELL
jgi:hypothetical protein